MVVSKESVKKLIPNSVLDIYRKTRDSKSKLLFPKNADELKASDIYKQWWYYSVELMAGVITQGHYEESFPMLPRMMLRNCEVEGASCLDIGTMEGIMPTLMARRGAQKVLAVDAIDHCLEKITAVQHYHNVNFDYQKVGLMYELDKKLPDQSFDLINCSGLLYHVVSPFLVLAGLRPLIKRNGLMIVSTNVVISDDFKMEFNNAGRLQDELNTFWYFSVPLLDYILRYLKLTPIDCLFLPHEQLQTRIRYLTDKKTGYLSIVCRAVDEVLPGDDKWMEASARESWEYLGLIDWTRAGGNDKSNIEYNGNKERHFFRADTNSMDLEKAVQEDSQLVTDGRLIDTHLLKLADRF